MLFLFIQMLGIFKTKGFSLRSNTIVGTLVNENEGMTAGEYAKN